MNALGMDGTLPIGECTRNPDLWTNYRRRAGQGDLRRMCSRVGGRALGPPANCLAPRGSGRASLFPKPAAAE